MRSRYAVPRGVWGAATCRRGWRSRRRAIKEGFGRVIRWQVGAATPLGLVARRRWLRLSAPQPCATSFRWVAAELERPRPTAVPVRTEWRGHRPESEAVALRLLPSWRLTLNELPPVAPSLLTTAS